VSMSGDTVVFLSRLLNRVDMDNGRVKVAQLMQQPMIDLPSGTMPLLDRTLRRHYDVDFCAQSMPQPPRPRLRHLFDPRDMSCCVPDFVYHFWIHSV
jgi:hypothetical protein